MRVKKIQTQNDVEIRREGKQGEVMVRRERAILEGDALQIARSEHTLTVRHLDLIVGRALKFFGTTIVVGAKVRFQKESMRPKE